jgi:exosome complex RNA-binding protein Csl4
MHSDVDFIFKGASMIPISWKEMQCPETMAKELRKVAKVQQ